MSIFSIRVRPIIFVLFLSPSLPAFAQNNLVAESEQLAKKFTIKDTLFKGPYIDKDEWHDKPVGHRYIHGGFKGTDTRFSFYIPSKEKFQWHFFQYITPVPISENLSQGASGEADKIGFCISHGAYFVESNGGGKSGAGMPGSGIDPKIGAYRANAACAEFSRVVANQIFGQHKIFGYAFGGSGGAYRTVGGIENTEGVWDGAVPYVLGSPMAIPNVFTIRIYAMQILHDKFPQIVDALEPGGGDVYAGLNDIEKQTLLEATQMGFPAKAWFAYQTMGLHAFPVLYPGVKMADAKYFKDFWTMPGYLGIDSTNVISKARIQKNSKIKTIISADVAVKNGLLSAESIAQVRGTADDAWRNLGHAEGEMPVAFQLQDAFPNNIFLGGDLIIKSGAANGKKLFVTRISGDTVVLGSSDVNALSQIRVEDKVTLDNSDFLAAETYHRHQVPGKEYHAWDQFRDSEGRPIYPQRPMLLGPLFTQAASGVLPTGKFNGKMILLGSLWDSEAFPWQQDWYRSKVSERLGDTTDNYFRLWYTDHANHADNEFNKYPTHIVSYLGVLQQALLDLSEWVEKGIAPPSTTNYKIKNSQIILPGGANERKGIQPVIALKANGSNKAEVKVGQTVTLNAEIESPPAAGKVVAAEWDFENAGTFSLQEKFTAASTVNLKRTHVFSKPGTYFVSLRVAAQREGDSKTPYTRIQNLDRVRVVVR